MPSLKNALALLFLLPLLAVAQIPEQPCGIDRMRKLNGFTNENNFPRSKTDTIPEDGGGYFIIPVVVHVIHNNGPENIHDSVVLSQIDVLNEDFGRYGKGANKSTISTDAGIRFCLATKDPNGNPTTGIIRVQSPYTRLDSDNEMLTKNLSRWDQKRYLNIWVVKDINGSNLEQGYAYYASDMAKSNYSERDGLVIAYRYFGRNSKIALSNNYLGHTTSHETGHYLELLHPWGDKSGDCNDDDGVDDTPVCSLQYQAGYNPITKTCDHPIQCGVPRQVENYMDYSEDRCLNMFTIGQVIRMRNAIRQFRPGLVAYANLVNTGCKTEYLTFNPPTEDKLQILASPAVNKVFLYPRFTENMSGDLFVYDELGQLVMQQHFDDLKTDKQEAYLPHLKSALYYFILKTPKKSFTEKILFLRDRK